MKKRAFIYIIIAGIMWGTSGIFVKLLSPYGLDTLQITSLRGLVSAIVMCAYALIFDRSAFRITLSELALLLGSGVVLYLTGAFVYDHQFGIVAMECGLHSDTLFGELELELG